MASPTVAGTNGDAVAVGNMGNTLNVVPGAICNGQVAADGLGNDALQLGGTTAATLTGLGAQITGFGSLRFDSGATSTVDSTSTGASELGFTDGFAADDKIDNSDPRHVTGATDRVEGEVPSKTEMPSSTESGKTPKFKVNDANGTAFIPAAIATGGGADAPVACYLRGTRILTEHDELAVEALRIGDRVATMSGGVRKIRWIGRRSYAGDLAKGNRKVLPILIRQSALSDGVPKRDLWVSPEHAMFLEGHLIPARALVNGVSILQEQTAEAVTYVHLELDTHDVIVAEGALSESYVNDESRQRFDNASEYSMLYPNAGDEPARYCAPRIEEGEVLEVVRQRLNARSVGMPPRIVDERPLRGNLDFVGRERLDGWALDETQPQTALRLRVLDNGAPLGEVVADIFRSDLQAAGIGDGRHAFVFDIPGGLDPTIRHLVEVQRADDGRALEGSPRVLEASLARTVAKTRSASPAPWRGNLETVTRERIEGWAWDQRSPRTPLSLVILDNGEVIGRVLANRYRKDLAGAKIGSGRHCFTMHIPGGLSPLTPHVIQVLGESDGCEMPTSPVIILPATGFDASLEQAVSSAVTGVTTPEQRDRALAFLVAQTDRLLQQSAEIEAGREVRLVHRQMTRRWGASDGDLRAAVASNVATNSPPRPRALVVDDWLPALGMDAGSNAILSHMHALKSLGYEVSIVAAEELTQPGEAGVALESAGFKCFESPYYVSVEEVLRRQRDCFEIIYLHRVSNAAKYLSLARHYAKNARILFAVADLHHLRLARQAQVEGRADLMAQSQRLRVAECTAAAAADVVITHSSVEAAWLRGVVRGANVHVVPWAVPLRATTKPQADRSGIAFIANFGFTPNLDAAHYLAEVIMPRVWQQDPSIECLLVGSRMPEGVMKLAGTKITVLGHVPDLSAVFERVRLTVAPMRFGAGIKGKVLESFAAGVPCVMSPVAAEGIDLPAAAAWVGSNADEFAQKLLHTYAGGTQTRVIVEEALAFIGKQNSDEAVIERLAAAIQARRVPGEPANTFGRIETNS